MNREQRRKEEKRQRTFSAREELINNKLHRFYQSQMDKKVEEINKLKDEHEDYLRLEKELRQERENNIENDWFWFYACLIVVLKDKYNKSNGKIAEFVDKLNTQITEFQEQKMTRDDLIRIAQEKADIQLCSKE